MLYKKGIERRRLIIDAALTLLNRQKIETISIYNIAKEANIPPSSVYHFFPQVQDVLVALAERFGVNIIETIAAPYSKSEARTWQQLYKTAVDRAIDIYQENPAYCQLIIGPYTPPEIKLSDRENDEQIGELFVGVLKQHFVLPEIKNLKIIMFHSIEIIDLFFSLSYIRHQNLVEEITNEGKIAAIAYLQHYLNKDLPYINSK